MIKHIYRIFKVFSAEEIGSPVPDLVTDYLFTVRKEGYEQYLSKEKVQEFHTVMTQLILLCNQARQYILVLVAFLTTRV